MTLILSAVAGSHVIQVSDRRLTYLDGRVATDESNKAVVLGNNISIGYTGLAVLEGLRTDRWIAQILVEEPTNILSNKATALARAATSHFQSIRTLNDRQKRHAFVMIGWTFMPEDMGEPSPVLISVSNALDNQANWLAEAKQQFEIQSLVGPTHRKWTLFVSHGATLDRELTLETYRDIRRSVRHGTSAEASCRLLIERMNSVGHKNPGVGKDLMVVCLPHPHLIKDDSVFLTSMAPKAPVTIEGIRSFRYLGSDSEDPRSFGPISVQPGVAVEFEAIRTDSTGSDGEFTIRRILPRTLST